MELEAAHRFALERDGYIVVPNALDAAWLAKLLRAFEDAPHQVDGTQHVTITEETPERDAWSALAKHPLLLAAADEVLGRPYRSEVHGRNPLPGFGQQGLHADWPPRSTERPYFVLTALWMLDAFEESNGATRVVPGSHRLLRPLPKPMSQPDAVHPDEVIVCGEAGSVLLLNGHLWHAGRRNQSQRTRRAVQMVLRAVG